MSGGVLLLNESGLRRARSSSAALSEMPLARGHSGHLPGRGEAAAGAESPPRAAPAPARSRDGSRGSTALHGLSSSPSWLRPWVALATYLSAALTLFLSSTSLSLSSFLPFFLFFLSFFPLFFFFLLLSSIPSTSGRAKQWWRLDATGNVSTSSAALFRNDFPGDSLCARDLTSRYFPKSFLCPKATLSRAEPRRILRPCRRECLAQPNRGRWGAATSPRSGTEEIFVIFLEVTTGPFLPVPPPAPLRPEVHRRLPRPVSAPVPIPMKPQAQMGAGVARAACPVGGEDESPPVASPDGIFSPFFSLFPSDLNSSKRSCAFPPERRTREGEQEMSPPWAASGPGARIFLHIFLPPLSSPCQVLFICFIPAPQDGRAEEEMGSLRKRPGEGSCGQGRPPAPPRGVRRLAALGGSGSGQVFCLFDAKLLSWGKSGFTSFAEEAG